MLEMLQTITIWHN